jgi:hypothetical protein
VAGPVVLAASPAAARLKEIVLLVVVLDTEKLTENHGEFWIPSLSPLCFLHQRFED